MTFGEFRKLTKDYPDETEIVLWHWKDGSHYYIANPTLTNNPTNGFFAFVVSLVRAYDITKEIEERRKNVKTI